MLRILMPAPQAASGPMPKLAELLAQGLRAHGCEVTIVPWGGGAGRGTGSRVAGRLGEVFRVRRAASSLRPDVILVQTSHDWVCVIRDLALSLAVARADRKLVLQFHGSRADALAEPGGLPFKWATRLLLRRADGVLVLSSEEQRALAAFEPRGRFRVVANPFLPAPVDGARTARNGAPVVLFASRLLPQKGVLETVDAFGLLRERLPASLVVAGDGPAAADVRRLVSERGLDGDVTLAGHLPPERLAESFRGADVFVLPTYHPEGFPTAISEAMSAGLPVVTSKVRGNADHLVEGTNALFVPPRDVGAIADALERVLTDPALRKRMAAANREKVKDFEPGRVAREYVALLAELVSPAKSGLAPGAADPAPREGLAQAAREGFLLAAELEWASHDPYDLLLSPLGRAVQARSWFGARVVVQAGRRSGTTVRRLLQVPEHREAKTLADFLRAAVLLSDAGETWASAYVPELAARLRTSSTATGIGRGWGLSFPYASRFVSVERGVPNLYTTTAACQALLDFHVLTDDAGALATALEGCSFLVDGLGTFEHAGSRWLRYWRDQDSPTVNVQASAASLLARAGGLAGDVRLLSCADEAARAALGAQRHDGSWPYSDDGRAVFVDGFHTGFTLQGLAEYASLRGADAVPGVTDAVERGFTYFVDHLLTADGLPRGFADGKASTDGQNVAQCIQTLVVCGSEPAHSAAALRLWRRCVEPVLLNPRHRFTALRWVIAPAVLATAYLASSASSSAYRSTIASSE
jgi:glycosyltransferase involved in cell wall biosynthesis